MSSTFQQIEQTLVKIGAASAIAFPGFISSEWESRAAAELAAEQMARIGCPGAKVSEVDGSWFCNWDQA